MFVKQYDSITLYWVKVRTIVDTHGHTAHGHTRTHTGTHGHRTHRSLYLNLFSWVSDAHSFALPQKPSDLSQNQAPIHQPPLLTTSHTAEKHSGGICPILPCHNFQNHHHNSSHTGTRAYTDTRCPRTTLCGNRTFSRCTSETKQTAVHKLVTKFYGSS